MAGLSQVGHYCFTINLNHDSTSNSTSESLSLAEENLLNTCPKIDTQVFTSRILDTNIQRLDRGGKIVLDVALARSEFLRGDHIALMLLKRKMVLVFFGNKLDRPSLTSQATGRA